MQFEGTEAAPRGKANVHTIQSVDFVRHRWLPMNPT